MKLYITSCRPVNGKKDPNRSWLVVNGFYIRDSLVNPVFNVFIDKSEFDKSVDLKALCESHRPVFNEETLSFNHLTYIECAIVRTNNTVFCAQVVNSGDDIPKK